MEKDKRSREGRDQEAVRRGNNDVKGTELQMVAAVAKRMRKQNKGFHPSNKSTGCSEKVRVFCQSGKKKKKRSIKKLVSREKKHVL